MESKQHARSADCSNIPVVFLTAYADEATLQRAKEVEPYGYLLKPFEETELHTAIEVVLKKHAAIETQLKEWHDHLYLSENRFKLFIESLKDYAIFMLDTQGNIISWNPGAEDTKGYKTEEIIGKPFSVLYSPEDLSKGLPLRHLQITTTQGRYEEEGWRVRKDGRKIWVSVVMTALRDSQGDLKGFGTVLKDLSEKKRSEDALRQSEESLVKHSKNEMSFSPSLLMN